MKMKLTIKDRLLFSTLYPQQSDILTQMLVRDISDKVKIEKEELDEIEFKPNKNGQGFSWNKEKAIEVEMEFTKTELEWLQSRVQELDKKKTITQDLLDLCLKIREDK